MKRVFTYLHNKTPLLCMFAGETAKLAFFFELTKSHNTANLLESMIMVLSLFSVPFIGFLSDKHCRKRTLVSTMLLGLLAVIILPGNGLLSSFIQGIVGAAVVPIARAMHLDIKADPQRNWKTSMAAVETVIVQALAWTFLSLYINHNITHIAVGLFILGILLLIPLTDKKDIDHRIIDNEILSVRKRYLEGYPWQVLMAFFLYDCAFQVPNYYSEAFFSQNAFSKVLNLVGAGILVGSVIIWILIAIFHERLNKKSVANNCLYKGLLVTSLGMLLVYLFPLFQTHFLSFTPVNEMTFFYFCCISGMLLALTFVFFGNMVRTHERGFMFSILEEIETLAEAVVPLFVFYLPNVNGLTNMPFIFLISLGILCLFRVQKITNSSENQTKN